ncbi:hypothetical protein OG21DRAFT_1028365 [Imleria badia]|nr:hypothetical protein OG21DRAFT_1028365 [Imleria badia]
MPCYSVSANSTSMTAADVFITTVLVFYPSVTVSDLGCLGGGLDASASGSVSTRFESRRAAPVAPSFPHRSPSSPTPSPSSWRLRMSSTPLGSACSPSRSPGPVSEFDGFVSSTRSFPSLLGRIPLHSAPSTTFRRSGLPSATFDLSHSPTWPPGALSITTRSFRRRAHSRGVHGVLGRCGRRLVWPFRGLGRLGRPEPSRVLRPRSTVLVAYGCSRRLHFMAGICGALDGLASGSGG